MAQPDPTGRLARLRAHGTDAVSFQALESSMRWWQDAPPPIGSGAAIGFVEAGRSWIAAGRPLCEADRMATAVARFTRDARDAGRRAVFFCVESLGPFAGFRHLAIGRQPAYDLAAWTSALRSRRRLREQLRRARAKGLTVRLVDADALAEGRPLRSAVEALASSWLDTRHLEPLGFLVSVEPFHAPHEHRYLVAEWQGEPVEFLSAVPIYTRGGWLVEDILRNARAPNGTTELMFDRLLREVGGESGWVTPGLTPLAGPIRWPLRVARGIARPLYDFVGLERFRARLVPASWHPVWMTWDRGTAAGVVVDVLRAFAGGALVSFGLRSVVRHPTGPAWIMSLPLATWTILLAVLTLTGQAGLLGFSTAALAGWVAFDALLVLVLFEVAHRPQRRRLTLVAGAAALDAVISIRHVSEVGFGPGWISALLRLLAFAGPVVGTAALAWGAYRARARRRA